ncbi:MAG: DUF4136 domain-containing protein [Alistipes shahii]
MRSHSLQLRSARVRRSLRHRTFTGIIWSTPPTIPAPTSPRSTLHYIPDSILIIGNSDKTEYWKDADAMAIIGTVVGKLDDAGYTRTEDKDAASVGIQLSYVRKVTYFVGYDYPYWWWYYPYYWAPGYWGDWVGWHYPYSVYYGYTAGSLLMEMLDLQADQESGKKLPIVWDSFIGGLLTSDADLNQQRTIDAVEQAFEQSPYSGQIV